jgi:hypothetical protein
VVVRGKWRQEWRRGEEMAVKNVVMDGRVVYRATEIY